MPLCSLPLVSSQNTDGYSAQLSVLIINYELVSGLGLSRSLGPTMGHLSGENRQSLSLRLVFRHSLVSEAISYTWYITNPMSVGMSAADSFPAVFQNGMLCKQNGTKATFTA